MFVIVSSEEARLNVKRIIDKGIPAEFKKVWEEAEEIWKK